MSQINDLKRAFYLTELGAGFTAHQLNDLERAWLIHKGADISNGVSLDDLWRDYLMNSVGVAGGHISDMRYRWLHGLGYRGTLQDMERSFYASSTPPPTTTTVAPHLWQQFYDKYPWYWLIHAQRLDLVKTIGGTAAGNGDEVESIADLGSLGLTINQDTVGHYPTYNSTIGTLETDGGLATTRQHLNLNSGLQIATNTVAWLLDYNPTRYGQRILMDAFLPTIRINNLDEIRVVYDFDGPQDIALSSSLPGGVLALVFTFSTDAANTTTKIFANQVEVGSHTTSSPDTLDYSTLGNDGGGEWSYTNGLYLAGVVPGALSDVAAKDLCAELQILGAMAPEDFTQ